MIVATKIEQDLNLTGILVNSVINKQITIYHIKDLGNDFNTDPKTNN